MSTHPWATSLGPISLLRRKHTSDPTTKRSLNLIVANWQEKTASNQSGPSDSEKHPSHKWTVQIQSHENVPTPQPRDGSSGPAWGPGSCGPRDAHSLSGFNTEKHRANHPGRAGKYITQSIWTGQHRPRRAPLNDAFSGRTKLRNAATAAAHTGLSHKDHHSV